MNRKFPTKLNPRKSYLQIALNGNIESAESIISQIPPNDRIIIEAGTPIIKKYGEEGIRRIRAMWESRLLGKSEEFSRLLPYASQSKISLSSLFLNAVLKYQTSRRNLQNETKDGAGITPYIVADLKTIDRAETEVRIAAEAGASAAIAMGSAPLETINSFVEQCADSHIDAMIDMMNVEYPIATLRQLKILPPVVILHRGVDEEKFNKEKQIPYHEIQRIKGAFNIMISIAGGDTPREVERSIFNGADIVIVWKSVFDDTGNIKEIVEGFLKNIH